MEKRQEQLLKLVIESYIKTAQPVGSQFLAQLGELDVSGATIRNELSFLEKEGFLTHPHTSAGRIPTELGYKYYVEHLADFGQVADAYTVNAKKIIEANLEKELTLKEVAKLSAAYSQNAIIIAFGKDKIYYTGISYLFAQPEFQNVNQTIRVSSIFDHCEEHVPGLFEKAQSSEAIVLIGSENPLGAFCSTVLVKMNDDLLVALLGPIRMDYEKNIGIISHIKQIFLET